MIAKFKISKIVIVQSLGNEFLSGEHLYKYILGFPDDRKALIPAEFINCEGSVDFRDILATLADEAGASGTIPLLHIECHGNSDHSGLAFRNGSSLKWTEIGEPLVALNAATRFNLLVIFALCFGAHHLGEMKLGQPSPCWGMIGPSEEIFPDELLGGFRDFYRLLVKELDLTNAVNLLLARKLVAGR